MNKEEVDDSMITGDEYSSTTNIAPHQQLMHDLSQMMVHIQANKLNDDPSYSTVTSSLSLRLATKAFYPSRQLTQLVQHLPPEAQLTWGNPKHLADSFMPSDFIRQTLADLAKKESLPFEHLWPTGLTNQQEYKTSSGKQRGKKRKKSAPQTSAVDDNYDPNRPSAILSSSLAAIIFIPKTCSLLKDNSHHKIIAFACFTLSLGDPLNHIAPSIFIRSIKTDETLHLCSPANRNDSLTSIFPVRGSGLAILILSCLQQSFARHLSLNDAHGNTISQSMEKLKAAIQLTDANSNNEPTNNNGSQMESRVPNHLPYVISVQCSQYPRASSGPPESSGFLFFRNVLLFQIGTNDAIAKKVGNDFLARCLLPNQLRKHRLLYLDTSPIIQMILPPILKKEEFHSAWLAMFKYSLFDNRFIPFPSWMPDRHYEAGLVPSSSIVSSTNQELPINTALWKDMPYETSFLDKQKRQLLINSEKARPPKLQKRSKSDSLHWKFANANHTAIYGQDTVIRECFLDQNGNPRLGLLDCGNGLPNEAACFFACLSALIDPINCQKSHCYADLRAIVSNAFLRLSHIAIDHPLLANLQFFKWLESELQNLSELVDKLADCHDKFQFNDAIVQLQSQMVDVLNGKIIMDTATGNIETEESLYRKIAHIYFHNIDPFLETLNQISRYLGNPMEHFGDSYAGILMKSLRLTHHELTAKIMIREEDVDKFQWLQSFQKEKGTTIYPAPHPFHTSSKETIFRPGNLLTYILRSQSAHWLYTETFVNCRTGEDREWLGSPYEIVTPDKHFGGLLFVNVNNAHWILGYPIDTAEHFDDYSLDGLNLNNAFNTVANGGYPLDKKIQMSSCISVSRLPLEIAVTKKPTEIDLTDDADI